MSSVAGESISAATIDLLAKGEPEWLGKRRRAAWAAYGEFPDAFVGAG